MEINKPAAPVQPAKPQTLWLTIGAAWEGVDKKGRKLLTAVIGNRRNNVNQITLNAGDRMFLRPNVKRANMPKDPDFQICVAQS